MVNSFSVLEIMWKSDLLWLSRPLDTILAFLDYNIGQIGPNFSNFDPIKPIFKNIMINSFSELDTMWNTGFVWLSRTLYMILAFWS